MGIQERREREREARRTAVLDATRSLVRERGFNGTTTKQIAKRCELSEATLFWYFKSKDEIFVSLLYEGIDFMMNGLESIRDLEKSSSERLARLWTFFGEMRQEHPEYFQIFSYLANPQATATVTDELKEDLARRSGENFRLFRKLLEELLGIDHARVVADVLWGAFVGLNVLKDSRINLGAKEHPTDAEMKEAFELLLLGIAPKNEGGSN